MMFTLKIDPARAKAMRLREVLTEGRDPLSTSTVSFRLPRLRIMILGDGLNS